MISFPMAALGMMLVGIIPKNAIIKEQAVSCVFIPIKTECAVMHTTNRAIRKASSNENCRITFRQTVCNNVFRDRVAPEVVTGCTNGRINYISPLSGCLSGKATLGPRPYQIARSLQALIVVRCDSGRIGSCLVSGSWLSAGVLIVDKDSIIGPNSRKLTPGAIGGPYPGPSAVGVHAICIKGSLNLLSSLDKGKDGGEPGYTSQEGSRYTDPVRTVLGFDIPNPIRLLCGSMLIFLWVWKVRSNLIISFIMGALAAAILLPAIPDF